jgi:hypothetical protein
LRRVLIGAALAVAVIVMGGLPASTDGAQESAMSGMSGMTAMAADSDALEPTGKSDEAALVVGCETMCDGPLLACLAVMALLVASALGAPSVRCLIRGPSVRDAGGVPGRLDRALPPWSVLSLSQLSVLRV